MYSTTHTVEGCLMRSEICFESWWELRTIMLCNVAGCCGMFMLIAPTLNTAALLVRRPLCALYSAWDFAILHLTTVLCKKRNKKGLKRVCWIPIRQALVHATNQFSCINCTHVPVCPVLDKVQCKTLHSKLPVLISTELQCKFLVYNLS